MKKILTIFNEERNQLQTDIETTNNVEQVVKLIQNRIDILERIYISELNINQVRLASFCLDILRQSIGTLAAATQTQITLPEQKLFTQETAKISPNRLILKLLKAIIYTGILGWLFYLTKSTPGAWMGILLASVLVGLEIVLQLDKNNQENNLNSPQLLTLPEPIIRVDSKIFLDQLADAFHTIDLAVARVEEGHKVVDDLGIEELPELLNFLQRLMGASFLNQPQMMGELVKLLPQILIEQGIRVQTYQSNQPDRDRQNFDFEPSIDPSTKDYITITPALLKGDRLLRRGRVIEPVYSEARE